MEHYHKRKHPADFVVYLPIDTKKNAKRWFEILPIKAIFFVKYEFWANYIYEAKQNKIPLYSISSIFRAEQVYFKNKNGFFASILKSFDAFFVQNENSKKLLNAIHIEAVSICGDTRFDSVIQHKLQAKENQIIGDFLAGKKAIILGSSWSIDEQFLQNFMLNHPSEKFIIAPHQIDEKHLKSIEQLFPQHCVRYTQWKNQQQVQILILDTIGMLSNAYQYGKIAYIGGGFTGKLHNILEPAVFGLPVLFGPKHVRFPEAQAFIDQGFGFELREEKDITNAIGSIQDTEKMKQKISDFVEQNTGAAQKIIDQLPELNFD
jgi:3-deoxy-D-manno-octulosonic-acid transferase